MDVRRLLRRGPVTMDGEASMRAAAARMAEEGVGAMVVTRGRKIAGIVSERDFLAAVGEGADPDDTLLWDLMVPEPFSVDVKTNVGEAARIMVDKGIRHLPVFEADQLCGVISMRDLLFAALEETAKEARADWFRFLEPEFPGTVTNDGG